MGVREEFEAIFDRWDKEMRTPAMTLDSTTIGARQLESFEKIIALGSEALPLIVEKLHGGHFMLNNAMEKITGMGLSEIKEAGDHVLSDQDISRLWIRWWKQNSKNYKSVSLSEPTRIA